MGHDTKVTAKQIKVTPGPADYSGTNTSAVTKASHNFKLNNGGLSKPPLYSHKEFIKNHNFVKNGRSSSQKAIFK
jgi:hypothetical protein